MDKPNEVSECEPKQLEMFPDYVTWEQLTENEGKKMTAQPQTFPLNASPRYIEYTENKQKSKSQKYV